MPLSKARDRERKRKARELGWKPLNVQPNILRVQRGSQFIGVVIPEIDADGNPIPDY